MGLKIFYTFFSFLFIIYVINAETIQIGVVLPLTPAGELANKSYALQQTIQLAVDEINTLNVLNSNTLQLMVADSEGDLGRAFFASQEVALNGSVAVIGDILSALSVNVQYVLRAYKIPQISADSSLDDLSNKTTFPYFLRLATKESESVRAVLSFINHMQWTQVIVFVAQGSETSLYLANKDYGIDVTTLNILPDFSNVNDQLNFVNNSNIGVIVILAELEYTEAILVAANSYGLLRSSRAWIGGDGLAIMRQQNIAKLGSTGLAGLVSVAASPGNGAKYDEFQQIIANNSILSVVQPLYRAQSKHYDAVFTIAYALQKMINAGQDYHNGELLLNELKLTAFQGASGLVSFDANGDLINPSFDIINYNGFTGTPNIVGNWTSSTGLQIYGTFQWPDFTSNTPSDELNSNILPIGLLLPLTGDLHILAASWRSAILYAINTINSNSMLPGYTISPVIKDSQASSGVAIVEAFNLANEGVLGVIGSGYSSDSETAQLVLRNFDIPQISGSATSDELSNKVSYPTFFRTVPADSEQGNALAQIVNYFGWRQVSVMLTDDIYSSNCYNVYSGIATRLGITTKTVQIMHTGSTDVSAYITNLKESNVLIFLLIALPGDAIVVLEEARKQGLLKSDYVWITSDGVATITDTTLIEGDNSELVPYMKGLIGTIASEGSGDVYDQFLAETAALDPAVFPGLNPPQPYTSFFYDCIYAYAYGFKLMMDRGWDLKNTSQFIDAIADVSFTGVTGQVEFDSAFDRTKVNFAIVNWRNNRFEEVATWQASTGFVFETDIIWPNGGTTVPDDTPERTYEENTLAAKIVLILLASLASLALVVAAIIFFLFRQSSVVQATNLVFASFLFVGGILGFMDIVVNSLSPPDDDLCRARVWVPCIAFALVYGALLSKFVHSFRVKKRTHIDAMSIFTVTIPVLIIEIIILVIWTSIPSTRPAPEDRNASGLNYVVWCIDSTVFVVITMVYKGLLMLSGIYLVIKTGEYPSYFSESHYLRLANWAVIATTCAGVALVYILDGEVVSMSVVYSIIVLIGLSLSLGFIFVPKCRLLIINKEGCRDSTAL